MTIRNEKDPVFAGPTHAQTDSRWPDFFSRSSRTHQVNEQSRRKINETAVVLANKYCAICYLLSPSSISHLASRISHLASRISHLASRISHLASRISHLASRISHLASRISHLPSPISHLPSPISHLPSPISHLPSPISYLLSPISYLLLGQDFMMNEIIFAHTTICRAMCYSVIGPPNAFQGDESTSKYYR
jgi:outer membrane murein-binding lipoprotein Lpp